MPKKVTEEIINIDETLTKISEDLTKLSKSTKLKDILKKHKHIKQELSIVSDQINQSKTLFESEIETSTEIIDDDTYEKYTKDITDVMDLDLDELDLETQIKKYRSVAKKILCCENYIKSKKMDLIDCDKKKIEVVKTELKDVSTEESS